MMLNTRLEQVCDKCCAPLNGNKYLPLNSKRGVEVLICGQCGLTQSFYTVEYDSRPPGNMSCDADRSSIRYTKSLVSSDYFKAISLATSSFDQDSHISFLDVGSNRGAFYTLISNKFKNSNFLCIEPDRSVIDYELDSGKIIVDRIENVTLEDQRYDIAYCVHSLEHVISAKTVLEQIFNSLKPKGKLILGVPKLELYPDVIEELFIDPHTFHFRHIDILEYAQIVGFDVEYLSDASHHDIIAVLSKGFMTNNNEYLVTTEHFSLKNYVHILKANRSAIALTAEKLSKVSIERPVLIWGAGRIFDCLCKQPTWKPVNFYLYDKFIRNILPEISGFKIIDEAQVAKLNADTLVVVASRDYFNEIYAEAKNLGFNDIRPFGGF